jgi:hypothetical protein
MRAEEIQYIETEVKTNLIPEIKKAVPGVLGWVIKIIFPKLERKIIDFIIGIVENILNNKK